MGKDSTKKKAPVRRRHSGGDDSAIIILLLVVILVVGVLSWQVALIALMGLVPTFVLAMTGRGIERAARLQTVAFMNLAGLMPIAIQVYMSPVTFGRVFEDPITWAIIWGSAGIGQVLLIVAPMVAAVILQALAQDELKKLNTQRQQLIEVWGPEVAQFEDNTGASAQAPNPGRR